MYNVSLQGDAKSPTQRGGANSAAALLQNPEWIRLPQTGTRSPLCGLSRSSLNELVLPCFANRGRPPVKSAVIKKRNATRGIRLIHVPSLLDYLNSLAADAATADAPLHVTGACADDAVDGGAS